LQFSVEDQPVFTTLTIKLDQSESVRAESGAMVSMSPTIQLKSKKQGKGLGGMLKAAMGGENMFASEYTAEGGSGEIVLAPPVPGDIIDFDLAGQTIMAQGGSYLAGTSDLELSAQGSLKAMVSGEGMFLQKISGTGKVFLSSYGAIKEKSLGAGEHYIVDTGHIIAFEESVTYSLQKASSGIMSTMLSGEGLVSDFVGPGKIWIQSRNLKGFAQVMSKLLPTPKN